MAVPSVLQFGVPGGPELLIVFLLFVLAFPAASLALGVGVGWWLRGRRGGNDPETETEPTGGAVTDDAATATDAPTEADDAATATDAPTEADDAPTGDGSDADDRSEF
ncbi:hypothetical protein GCM10027435_10200 [Haloparvum alkalitolerans]|uniref:hypothetical protein n=1 Tax=Haloparvum alkalitolerans TaxID=1042953 RepID=UPI003CF776CD